MSTLGRVFGGLNATNHVSSNVVEPRPEKQRAKASYILLLYAEEQVSLFRCDRGLHVHAGNGYYLV